MQRFLAPRRTWQRDSSRAWSVRRPMPVFATATRLATNAIFACAHSAAAAAAVIAGGLVVFPVSVTAQETTPAATTPAATTPAATIPAATTPALVPGVVAGDSGSEKTAIGERIEQWILDLDAPQFGKRQAAAQRLAESGEAAFPRLLEAARHPSREVSERAIDLLEQHYRVGDTKLKTAAAEALRQLAGPEDGPDPTDRVARAARAVLRPAAEANLPVMARGIAPAMIQAQARAIAIGGGANVGRIRIAPGGIAPGGIAPGGIAPGGIAPGGIAIGGRMGRSVSISNINGEKKVRLSENNRKVSIDIAKEGPITVELTETKDGKSTTRKFEAKNLDELKQKHPDAHKVYEELAPMFDPPRNAAPAPPRVVLPMLPPA